jgi:DNA-directed RNA polymerase sigma subunit (sigma70/sigma32)
MRIANEIIEKVSKGDTEAHKTCFKNLRSVGFCLAKQYGLNTKSLFEDIEQAVNIGIWMAAKKFEASRGFSFNTFVYFYIRKEVLVLVRREQKTNKTVAYDAEREKRTCYLQSDTLAVNDIKAELAKKAGKDWDILEQVLDGNISMEQAGEKRGCSREKIRQLIVNLRRVALTLL